MNRHIEFGGLQLVTALFCMGHSSPVLLRETLRKEHLLRQNVATLA